MSLLLQYVGPDTAIKPTDFTFHYVSITTRKYQGLSADVSVLTLHSTMSLLLLVVHCVLKSTSVFTFHYVSITTGWDGDPLGGKAALYIPLCLYYYCLGTNTKSEPFMSLHSTMSLLLPQYYSDNDHQWLTLHSTMSLLLRIIWYRFTFPKILYIPLCLYYYFFISNLRYLFEHFTFHYVSITTRHINHCDNLY